MERPTESEKLNIEVFVPLDSCTCMFQPFVDQVFEIILPYKQNVKFEVKNVHSAEAKARQILQNVVVVNGKKKFFNLQDFQYFLKDHFNRVSSISS